ncbi:MAG: acetyltransferase [Proteobacteria bacterium]|nr:acetyltransferase [Pseudomonadota bacterium]
MTGRAAVFGAGGHARVVGSILRAVGREIIGFFDDSFHNDTEIIQGAPLLGRFGDLDRFRGEIEAVYLALGDNARRQAAYADLDGRGFRLPALVHPRSLVEADASVGAGSVVCLGAILAAEVRIGPGCIVNTGASVDHECEIGDFVHLAPRATVAGRTRIGPGAFVGAGAVIADRLRIGRGVIIGANATVLADVPDGARIVGVHKAI